MRWTEYRRIFGTEKDADGNYWTVTLARPLGPHEAWWVYVELIAPRAGRHREATLEAEQATAAGADIGDAKRLAGILCAGLQTRLRHVRGGQ